MERLLVTKLVRTDNTRADLYGKGHQYKDLTLFDLGELAAVGIDPAGLAIGQEVPCRFWAVYTLSDKLNKSGNPYRDVLALERIDTPATATSVDTGAILAELRAVRALLAVLAQAQGLEIPELGSLAHGDPDPGPEPMAELDAAFPRFGDGTAVPEAAEPYYHEHVKATGQAPANVDALRAWAKANGLANGNGK